jgi:hypothetical protein
VNPVINVEAIIADAVLFYAVGFSNMPGSVKVMPNTKNQ